MILGVDPGERRVGLAIADVETRFARPLDVIEVGDGDVAAEIARIAAREGVDRIVVGKPVGLSGRTGPAAVAAADLAERLRRATAIEVVEYDERLTTVIAERSLRAAGSKAAARRSVRDAVAAQVMLQGYLDARR